MRRLFFFVLFSFLLFQSSGWSFERFERLKSRFGKGVDFYRDGPFTISRLTKQPLSDRMTLIRGVLTNDTNKRAVSIQLEITCYNASGDFLDNQLTEVNYLDSRQSQTFQARIRQNAEQITLYEASIQDVIWDEF